MFCFFVCSEDLQWFLETKENHILGYGVALFQKKIFFCIPVEATVHENQFCGVFFLHM